MNRFRPILEQNQPVSLINNYRGFPISFDAQILDISQDYVSLRVHPYQAVCMILEGKTYVRSDLLPEVYLTRTITVDILENEARVTEIVGVGETLGNRALTRVQPKEPVEVEIRLGDRNIPGRLADISTTGIGIFSLETYIYGDFTFEENAEVDVEFELPLLDRPVRPKGQVINLIRQEGAQLCRLGIKILPDPSVDELLEQYVSIRQDEIMQELSRIYDSMHHEKQGKAQ